MDTATKAEWVILLLLMTGAFVVLAGGALDPESAQPDATTQGATGVYFEAPMLAELVRAGALPPVDERLPEDPMVIEPIDSIGRYGGELNRSYLGPSDSCNMGLVSRNALARYSVDGSELVPFIATGWEPSNGGSVWTYRLRRGLHWSNGDAFDADDFVWHYHQVLLNDELTPSQPFFIRQGGEVGKIEKLDDYTVVFRFTQPNFIYPEIIAQADGGCGGASRNIPFYPAEYLEQFHKDFNPQVDALVAESGFASWTQLFDDKVSPELNPDRPSMRAWVYTQPIGEQIATLERNAFFYAVDPANNQLPYIDRLRYRLVQDTEVLNLNAVAGELDMQGRHISTDNLPVLMENADSSGYRVLLWPAPGGTDAAIYFNMSYPGALGDVIRTDGFRQALSIAIDRDEINDIVYLGLGKARQSVPAPGHAHYPGDEYASMWTEYDPEQAQRMLDRVLPNKDRDGFRLLPNGEPLVLGIGTTAVFAAWPDVAELTVRYWADVGVRAEMDSMARSLFNTKRNNNELPTFVWNDSTAPFTFTSINRRAPLNQSTLFGPAYGLWNQTNGASGIEPPAFAQEILDMHLRGPSLPDDERNELGRQIHRNVAEKVYNIGILGMSPMVKGVVVANVDLGNVPDQAANMNAMRTPSTAFPEQWYWKN